MLEKVPDTVESGGHKAQNESEGHLESDNAENLSDVPDVLHSLMVLQVVFGTLACDHVVIRADFALPDQTGINSCRVLANGVTIDHTH